MRRLSGTAAAVAVLLAGGFALSSMVVLGPATDQRSVENPYPISQGGPGPSPTATKTVTATAPPPRRSPSAGATSPKAPRTPTTAPTTAPPLRAAPALPTTAPTTAPPSEEHPLGPPPQREEPLGPPVPPLEPVDPPPAPQPEPTPEPPPAPETSTTLIVGVDIAPGPHTAPGGPTCLWQRLVTDDIGGALVVAEGGGQGEQMVDVAASDTALRSVGCGQWLPAPPPQSAPEGEAAPLPSPDGP